MEIFRPAGRATQITFPIKDLEGRIRTGATSLDSEWVAWADTAGPLAQGNPGFADMAGEAAQLGTTGVYTLPVAATELPAASPYVMIRIISANAATQYVLIRTASAYANVTGISGTDIASPVTGGYMPIDVKQSIALAAPADNSIEKSLARSYMAATHYINAAITSRIALSDTVTLVTPTDNTVDKALARMYMFATNYGDASISSRLAPVVSGRTVDVDASGGVEVGSFQTGAITNLAFAANAIEAAGVAVDVGSEFADALIGRNIRGGSSIGRRVYEAIAWLRNHSNILAGTLTVYREDDSTTEWTAVVATQAVSAIVTDIDPA